MTGQFVRALGDVYHVKCFCCHECGKECASKFFSSETTDPETGKLIKIALCEQDYFKKLDLVCYSCQNALRGPYVTALGRKYHLEHFTCSVCNKIFEKDESFYEHDNGIYCHYHYSKQYACHCEGCHSPILKQYLEIFRGGRIQQWHPECFMVHKFWSITVTADYAGLPIQSSKLVDSNGRYKNLAELDLTSNELFDLEQKLEQIIISIWITFSNFEEATLACISNMLQYASTGQQLKGLLTTGQLILMVENLFNGINVLHSLGVENLEVSDPKYQNLRKEPRSLSAKIMTYLALLRKSNKGSTGHYSKDLLSLITGLAHYLKLIIRYGLYHALQHNKFSHSNLALERFSKEVRAHKSVPNDVFPTLDVPANSTDSCSICNKSIEKECVLFELKRWHLECLHCTICNKLFTTSTIQDASYNTVTDSVYCSQCSVDTPEAETGFENVSRLSQLVYLLKIALVRSKVIMDRDSANFHQPSNVDDKETEMRYKQTLSDIKRMRSTRRDQKMASSVKQNARRSRIIEAPDGDVARSENLDLENEDGNILRKLSFLHSDMENQLTSRGQKLIVEDEPQSTVYFDRTTDLLKNQKSLTLDDIPRIVSAEQAREQRPNAFKHLTHSNATIDPKPKSIKLAGRSNTVETTHDQTPIKEEDPSKNKKSVYYAELTPQQHFVLRHIAVILLLNIEQKYTREELLGLIPTKKAPTFWGKLFKSSDSNGKKSLNSGNLNVFGLPLEELTAKYGVESDLGVGPAKLVIPTLLDDCISALHQMDMSVEGVFRKNGNIKGLRLLTELIDSDPTHLPDFTKETPIQLAALLKKFLRELPDPLLTFKLYDLWISSQRYEDDVSKYRILKICNCMLPTAHRDFAEVLFYFLRWVTSFSYIDKDTGSKMHTHNLATVITPNILYLKPQVTSKQEGGLVLDLIPGGELYLLLIEVLDMLLQAPEDFSTVPDYLYEFMEKCGFNKDQEMTTKDIMQKCDLFMKLNPNFFQTFFEQESYKGTSDSRAVGTIRE